MHYDVHPKMAQNMEPVQLTDRNREEKHKTLQIVQFLELPFRSLGRGSCFRSSNSDSRFLQLLIGTLGSWKKKTPPPKTYPLNNAGTGR